MGVSVRYLPLSGCEARILGARDRAVVSVNSRSSPGRKRFSLAHELGHWKFHRGQSLFCRESDIGGEKGKTQPERVANDYAANLLMPGYLFDPLIDGRAFGVASVDQLAKEFSVSRTAAAIRFVRRSPLSLMLVTYNQHGRGWFCTSAKLHGMIWPRRELDPQSLAFALIYGRGKSDSAMRKAPADHWIDGVPAKRFDLQYQAYSTSTGIHALLQLNPEMVAQYLG